MKIEVINEKRLNHIHYCRVHKENQRLSGSFWVPSKSKSKNKKMFSFELNDSDFLVCDPEHYEFFNAADKAEFDEYIDSRGYGVSSKIRNETRKNRRSVNVAYGISL